jgi:membrane protein
MKKNRSNRIIYLDVVKFLAIWMVCIGHSYFLVDMSRASILYNWIYSFHMPLFMMLCGYFSLKSYDKPVVPFFKQKTIQLLLPTVTISILTIIVCFLINLPDIAIVARNEAIGGMWFLRTLFFCFVYTYLFKRLGWQDYFTVIGSIVLALILPHGYFLQFNWMLIFFWLGYFLKCYRQIYMKYLALITMFSLLVFILLCVHEVPKVLTYHILFFTPWQLFSQFVSGLFGSLSLIGISYYFCLWFKDDNFLVKKMAEVGTYTLGIYGLQSIILQRIFVKYVHFDTLFLSNWITDFIIVPSIALFSVIFCYYCILFLKKSRIINLFFFGNQYER